MSKTQDLRGKVFSQHPSIAINAISEVQRKLQGQTSETQIEALTSILWDAILQRSSTAEKPYNWVLAQGAATALADTYFADESLRERISKDISSFARSASEKSLRSIVVLLGDIFIFNALSADSSRYPPSDILIKLCQEMHAATSLVLKELVLMEYSRITAVQERVSKKEKRSGDSFDISRLKLQVFESLLPFVKHVAFCGNPMTGANELMVLLERYEGFGDTFTHDLLHVASWLIDRCRTKSFDGFQTNLILLVIRVLKRSSLLQMRSIFEHGSKLLICTLNLALNFSEYDASILACLELMEVILRKTPKLDDDIQFYVGFGLQLIILHVRDEGSRVLATTLTNVILEKASKTVAMTLVPFTLLPLFKLSMELVNTEIACIQQHKAPRIWSSAIADEIERIEKSAQYQQSAKGKFRVSIMQTWETSKIGLLDIAESQSVAGEETRLLLLGGQLFSWGEEERLGGLVRLTSYMKIASHQEDSLFLMRCLLFLLKWDPSSTIRNKILLEHIPNFGSFHDAYITYPALRVTKSLTGSSGSQNPSLAQALGLRMLSRLAIVETRVWPHFRSLANTIIVRIEKTELPGYSDLALSFFSSLRDLCVARTDEYGEDLLPLAARGLKCKGLDQFCKVCCLEVINLGVEAKVADAKAVWTSILKPFIRVTEPSTEYRPLYIRFFRFYSLLQKSLEDTEGNLAFMEELVREHILPFIVPADQESELGLVDAAYEVLSQIDSRITSLLIPPPPVLIVALTTCSENLGRIPFLKKLLISEIETMRKPVFKALSTLNADEEGSKVAYHLEAYVKKYQKHLYSLWEGSSSSPHLRSSLAGPMLVSPASSIASFDAPFHKRQPFYKILLAGLNDSSFKDNNLMRLQAFDFWLCFWDDEMGRVLSADNSGDNAFLEQMLLISDKFVTSAIDELFERRLKAERASPTIWNILLSLAALVNAASKYESVVALEFLDKFVKFLTEEYFFSQACEAEESRAAAVLTLAYLGRSLSSTDEATLKKIVRFFFTLPADTFSDDSGFRLFIPVGVALILEHIFATSPSNELIEEAWDYLIARFTDDEESESVRLGSAIGISLCRNVVESKLKLKALDALGIALMMRVRPLFNLETSSEKASQILPALWLLCTLIEAPASRYLASPWTLESFSKALNEVQAEKLTDKVARLLALPCLFEDFFASTSTPTFRQDTIEEFPKALETLKELIASKEPRECRVAGFVIARLLKMFFRLSRGSNSSFLKRSTVAEPLTYSRLNIPSLVNGSMKDDIVRFICLQSETSNSAQIALLNLFSNESFHGNTTLVTVGIGRVLELGGLNKNGNKQKKVPEVAQSKMQFFRTVELYVPEWQAIQSGQSLEMKVVGFAAKAFRDFAGTVEPCDFARFKVIVSLLIRGTDAFQTVWHQCLTDFRRGQEWERKTVLFLLSIAALIMQKPASVPSFASDAVLKHFSKLDFALCQLLEVHLKRSGSNDSFAATSFMMFAKDNAAEMRDDTYSWFTKSLDVCISLDVECNLYPWSNMVLELFHILFVTGGNSSKISLSWEYLEAGFLQEFSKLAQTFGTDLNQKILKRILNVNTVIRQQLTQMSEKDNDSLKVAAFFVDLLSVYPAEDRNQLWEHIQPIQ
ncbi:hypothetical protein HDU97_009215 [Phlyctochytrium planicorne]|nr:hypothetical protein HDU97_009215 [Phlyctochytrium planicorne]